MIRNMVRAQLFLDDMPWTSSGQNLDHLVSRNQELQTEWLNEPFVPAYVIVTPDGKKVLSRFVGSHLPLPQFRDFLSEGITKWEAHKADAAAETSQ